MQSSLFKIVSAIVLIAVVSMFSGLAEPVSASATPETKAEKSCCDGCDDSDQGQESVPCSTSVCPAFLCLSFVAVKPFVPQVSSLATADSRSFVSQPIINQYVKSIFHPPAIA